MITPTVGRVVWFHAGAHATNLVSDQPLAAMITYVNEDDTINLVVFGKGGDCHQRASVPLWQGDGDAPERRTYAEWMPYQKGQAAKLKEAEKSKAEAYDLPVSDDAVHSDVQSPEWHNLPRNPPQAPLDMDAVRAGGYERGPDGLTLQPQPTYRATPVKPSTEPVQPLPPAPIDPDPYASSVDSVGDLVSPANPDRPLD